MMSMIDSDFAGVNIVKSLEVAKFIASSLDSILILYIDAGLNSVMTAVCVVESASSNGIDFICSDVPAPSEKNTWLVAGSSVLQEMIV